MEDIDLVVLVKGGDEVVDRDSLAMGTRKVGMIRGDG